jgi:hypothetical protein
MPLVHPRVPFAIGAQLLEQVPQLSGSVAVDVSQPPVTGPTQWEKPALHVPIPHVDAAQPAVAFGGAAQPMPHMPQFVGSVARSDSQPFDAIMSQSA